MSIYDFELLDIDAKKVSMSAYKGSVLLIVNVASECGFTPQYTALEALYQKYKKDGLKILAFPSNQFKNQESASNEKIKIFCEGKYDIHFDLFGKGDVNGEKSMPLYTFLKKQQAGFLGTESIKWNFTKFLVDREGSVVGRYAPFTKPEKLESQIEKLLSQ